MRRIGGSLWARRIVFVVLGFLLFIYPVACLEPPHGELPPEINVALETAWGLHTVTFETPHGTIKVYLCDRIAANDTIALSILTDPGPEWFTDYTVRIGDTEWQLGTRGSQSIPPGIDALPVILIVQPGDYFFDVWIPIETASLSPVPDFPQLGQAGKPLQISGTFNTTAPLPDVLIDEVRVDWLAASPRQAVYLLPDDMLGSANISLIDPYGMPLTQWEIRIVSVALYLPQGSVNYPGEFISGMVVVEGLLYLLPQEAIPTTIANKTPEVVDLEGGNRTFIIAEGDPNLDPDTGIWLGGVNLTGIQPRLFQVEANLALHFCFINVKGCEDFLHNTSANARTQTVVFHSYRDGNTLTVKDKDGNPVKILGPYEKCKMVTLIVEIPPGGCLHASKDGRYSPA